MDGWIVIVAGWSPCDRLFVAQGLQWPPAFMPHSVLPLFLRAGLVSYILQHPSHVDIRVLPDPYVAVDPIRFIPNWRNDVEFNFIGRRHTRVHSALRQQSIFKPKYEHWSFVCERYTRRWWSARAETNQAQERRECEDAIGALYCYGLTPADWCEDQISYWAKVIDANIAYRDNKYIITYEFEYEYRLFVDDIDSPSPVGSWRTRHQ